MLQLPNNAYFVYTCHLQMFGSSFYGLVDKDYRLSYKEKSRSIKKYDINDFIHKDCAYAGPVPSQSEIPRSVPPHQTADCVMSAAARASSAQRTSGRGDPSASTSRAAAPAIRIRVRGPRASDPSSSRVRPDAPAMQRESPLHRPAPDLPLESYDDDDLPLNPFGTNVGRDLSSLLPDAAQESSEADSDKSESSPSSSARDDAGVLPDEVLTSQVRSVDGHDGADVEPLQQEAPHAGVGAPEDDCIILSSDSSDDEGHSPPVACRPHIDPLVSNDVEREGVEGEPRFVNAAGEAPPLEEVVKYEPRADYFQHLAYRRKLDQKAKQDMLEQLEASKRMQAEMEATLEKQKAEFALEKERMAATIRAELQQQMKADLAQMLRTATEASSSGPPPPEVPAVPSYPRIEDNSGSGLFTPPEPSAELQQSVPSVPILGHSSDDIQHPGGAPVIAVVLEVPSTSLGLPEEYPRHKDTPVVIREPSPVVAVDACVVESAAIEAPVVAVDACTREEERVDYEPSPDGPGHGASDSDKVG